MFSELRRRNVIRMAGLYLVGAWLMVQVAETLLPIFGTPGWVLRTLVLLLALGFIPALVFAWVFELTPEGLKRDRGAASAEPGAPRTGQRMDRLLLAGLVLVVGLVAADRFWPRNAVPVVATGGAPATAGGLPAASLGIAVLPFDNLSPDPDNAFFAGGIYEEVLTRLSRIPDLRVISRTSMETVAAEKLDVAQIATRLGVSHVLEGSVRRAGDTVRITVQLIEAGTDKHVWAENYDRKLDDVFAIQSEIALAIAGQLQVALSPAEQSTLGERPTDSAEAYDLYLRAVELQKTWRGAEGFLDAIAVLEPAVALDPDFADARVALSNAYGRMHWLGEDPEGRYKAKADAELAEIQARWPDTWRSRLAAARYVYNVEQDYEAALAALTPLQAERPNDVDVALSIAGSLKRLGRFEEQLVVARRAQALDPESEIIAGEVSLALEFLGRGEEAIAQMQKTLRIAPESPSNRYRLAMMLLEYRGDRGPLLALDERSALMGGGVSLALFSEGEIDAAIALTQKSRATAPDTVKAFLMSSEAGLLRLASRDDEARPIARRALEQVQAMVDAVQPPLDVRDAILFSQAAVVAAVADEPGLAKAWTQRALEVGELEFLDDPGRKFLLAYAQRWLGDVEGAWLAIEQLPESHRPKKGELKGFRPYYDALYGESPSYRAYVARQDATP